MTYLVTKLLPVWVPVLAEPCTYDEKLPEVRAVPFTEPPAPQLVREAVL